MASLSLSGLLLSPLAASAAPTSEDAKIVEGYQRVTKLLDTWVESTTVCFDKDDNPLKGNCERNPVKVMEVLGYKSTTSPLFNMEKTLLKIQMDGELDRVLADRWGDDAAKKKSEETRFRDAAESYMQSADEGSGMAYVSSWGEANPGGGKDRVELFIERSKKDVINCKKNLGTMKDVLGLT